MTTYADRCAVYDEALGKWGLQNQLLVAIEEMSEVQKAITKLVRAGNAKTYTTEAGLACLNNLAEEIADATIMLEQLKYYFGMNAEVEEMMDKKILRLKGRLGE